MANQPISVVTAREMIQEYITYMTNHEIDMGAQTHNVGFGSAALLQWMHDVEPYTDEFRICMGVYNAGPYQGRITTIIWPYNSGSPAIDENEKEIEPFNEGDLEP
ncbi:MAG TPA: hypothetical protein VF476_07995 [Chitinophagaceae bacterium]